MAKATFATPEELRKQREFLDSYYSWAGPIYDLTRKYFLFGRDRVLERLAEQQFASLLEIGSGTGRNLEVLRTKLERRARPMPRLHGLDLSRAMLSRARKSYPMFQFHEGAAEVAPLAELVGEAPERVLFSYCLSMLPHPELALDHALSALAPGGELHWVDFGACAGLSPSLRRQFLRFLAAFHVEPLPPELYRRYHAEVEAGPFDYYRLVRIRL